MARKKLSSKIQNELIEILNDRFVVNMDRHVGCNWDRVLNRILRNQEKLWSLNEMEITGGEPDIVVSSPTEDYVFYDCSVESPKGRRSVCYDEEALRSRKENRPPNSAVSMAIAMGIEILSEAQYRELQKIGNFDSKTSSWLKTPPEIRKLGGAIFADRRYGNVFVYHNGAESYYAARSFRGALQF